MVTCTRTRCHGSDTCICQLLRPTKRKRADSLEPLRPRKVRKTNGNLALSPIESSKTSASRAVRARVSRCRGSHEGAKSDAKASEVVFPLTPGTSDSASREDARACRRLYDTRRSFRNGTSTSTPRPSTMSDRSAAGTTQASAGKSGGTQVEQNDTIRASTNCDVCKHTQAKKHTRHPQSHKSPTHVVAHTLKTTEGEVQVRLKRERSWAVEASGNSHCGLALGPSIPPPTNLVTPPEYVPPASEDPKFLQKFDAAYALSRYADALRAKKYGADVAAESRKGLTPEEDRQRWQALAEKQRAEADASSDSDSCEYT